MKKHFEQLEKERRENLLAPGQYSEESLFDFVECLLEPLEMLFDVGMQISSENAIMDASQMGVMGRSILRDTGNVFKTEYDFIVQQIGDIRLRKALYRNDHHVTGGTRLGVVLEKADGQKLFFGAEE